MDGRIDIEKSKSRSRAPAKDAERSKADILDVATREFAASGLSGARIDTIAALTRTSKRMIYYYFGSKEGLYLAVLENIYAKIRAREASLSLEDLGPVEALRELVEQTFENDDANEDFVRLISIENIHFGRHLVNGHSFRDINSEAIQTLRKILLRGQAAGQFRHDIEPLEVHFLISALCFFRVSNRHTFGRAFEIDLTGPENRRAYKRLIVDAVLKAVKT